MSALVPPRTRPQRMLLLALIACMALAQTLGWMHRGLHGGGEHAHAGHAHVGHAHVGHVHAHGEPAAAHGHNAAGEPAGHWIGSLFGAHSESADCRLFDVLGQPGCASAVAALALVRPDTVFLARSHAEFVARWAALFDARGPPATR